MMAFAVMRVRSLFLLLAQRELERLYSVARSHDLREFSRFHCKSHDKKGHLSHDFSLNSIKGIFFNCNEKL
jgi:hypothetical protein